MTSITGKLKTIVKTDTGVSNSSTATIDSKSAHISGRLILCNGDGCMNFTANNVTGSSPLDITFSLSNVDLEEDGLDYITIFVGETEVEDYQITLTTGTYDVTLTKYYTSGDSESITKTGYITVS